MTIETTIRRLAIFALLGVVSFGAYRLVAAPVHGAEMAESRLADRVEQYIELRKADDQVAIYNEMMDPEQCKIKDLATFLEFHGKGVLKVLWMEWDNMRIDEATQSARISMTQEVELQPEKLPPPFDDIEVNGPEDLRRTATEELEWVWREGDWYVRMDRAFIKGESADGRKIQAFEQK